MWKLTKNDVLAIGGYALLGGLLLGILGRSPYAALLGLALGATGGVVGGLVSRVLWRSGMGMEITKRDALFIAGLAVATAVGVYFASEGSLGAALLGLLVGAVGGIIPCILLRIVSRQ